MRQKFHDDITNIYCIILLGSVCHVSTKSKDVWYWPLKLSKEEWFGVKSAKKMVVNQALIGGLTLHFENS